MVQIVRAKVISESEATEDHMRFAKWRLVEWTQAACELTEPDEEEWPEWVDHGNPVGARAAA